MHVYLHRGRAFLPTPSARRATICDEVDFAYGKISTHALREEGDIQFLLAFCPGNIFLPTPSARRATATIDGVENKLGISTHALREEGDYPRRVR